ncbi:MAG: polyphosphate kinase 1, partial [Gemmatimonadota bacterium]
GMPLAERLRYLAIVHSNLDEFFAVRVGALKAAILAGSTQRSFDGLRPSEQIDAISARVAAMIPRQTRCMQDCFAVVATRGIRLRSWDDLDPAARTELTVHFQHELFPVLTPRAVTMSPGHPSPMIPQLAIAFAVLVRDVHTGPVHFAYLAIPARLPRLLAVPGSNDLIPIEQVVRANLQAFYPDRPVEEAWAFRVTRAAELDVNEEEAGDLLQAVEEEVGRRSFNPPVRVEIEAGMSAVVRDLLLRELRFERRGVAASLGDADAYPVEGLMARSSLRALADRLPATDAFAPWTGRRLIPTERTIMEQLDEGDILVHHPYDDFEGSVTRFLKEAAEHPEVVAIKIALYRIGEDSPIVDAMVQAAQKGKEVSAFVEVRARFDEARNVKEVKRLEEVGVHVVYGLVGLKIHAKVTLAIRQSPTGVRRYAHVATGNYNAGTARYYTDLGLFTADEGVTADLTDLFNELTGSTQPPAGQFRRLLISPVHLVPEMIRRVEREMAFVDEGQQGRIRMQLNGLEDPELVAALYRAAQAGVEIDLVIRGLCLLKPGVPGLSERIRVKSVLGRFLEHERIFHFGNGAKPEYFIGSADLRPRNLRRRVEVVAPVRDPKHVARLDRVLTELIGEPAAWSLGPDGTYTRAARPTSEQPHVHDRLLTGEG